MKLITLSPVFYERYHGCEEILIKQTRPYVCLAVKVDGVTFAIPFRHHIPHKWAFFTVGEAGLDYSKAVVISEWRFINSSTPTIEQEEFNILKGKDALITNGMRKFLIAYRNAVKYPDNKHYDRIRSCSSLQYFHRELRIR